MAEEARGHEYQAIPGKEERIEMQPGPRPQGALDYNSGAIAAIRQEQIWLSSRWRQLEAKRVRLVSENEKLSGIRQANETAA